MSEKIVQFPKFNLQFYVREDTNDRGIIAGVETYGTNFYGTVIVIGAHIGGFSCFAARNGATKVYCYEPSRSNFELLVKNIKLNHLENIVFPRNIALSSKKEKRLLYIPTPFSNTGRRGFYYSRDKKTETVQCDTLENVFIEENIKSCDFIKSDCEGGEYAIFLNISDDILSKIRKIAMEAHFMQPYKTLVDFFEKKGFEVTTSTSGVPEGAMMLFANNIKSKRKNERT